MNKTKIFVDGNCIVCDLEIAHYKRMAPDLFEIVDISDETFKAESYGFTKEAVNTNIHVLTPSGELKVGVDAFAHIWSRLGRYQIASKAIMLPGIQSVAKAGYKVFTVVRPYLPKRN